MLRVHLYRLATFVDAHSTRATSRLECWLASLDAHSQDQVRSALQRPSLVVGASCHSYKGCAHLVCKIGQFAEQFHCLLSRSRIALSQEWHDALFKQSKLSFGRVLQSFKVPNINTFVDELRRNRDDLFIKRACLLYTSPSPRD